MRFSLRQIFVVFVWFAVAMAMAGPLFTLEVPRESPMAWDTLRMFAFFCAGIPFGKGLTLLTGQSAWFWILTVAWPIFGTFLLIALRAPITLP